ncbi:hypothetical protein ZWY2020_005358 [Hordeum vulgare]|nr:hypothetical protein ZWY2020_005358 [Hordeum vulgare]
MVEDVEEEDEEEEDDSMLNQHIQRPKIKANWTDRNTLTLCEIACEEIDAGNYAGRVWSPQAYKNMREKYWERAKLWHPGREFKNKITNLKGLYNDWLWLQQQTGCGHGSDGEVTATADWWEKEIKDRPNLKKFRNGNPEYMPLLHEIFHEVAAVDGSSAYVPGTEDCLELNNDDDLDGDEGFVPSPMSTSTQKRGSRSELRSTASSPSKRSKTLDDMPRTHGKTRGPFVKYMKDIETKLEKESEKTDSILQALVNQGNEKVRRSEERAQSVKNRQNLAIECGASEESVEYFVACDLFKEKHNRTVFQNMKTPEARLIWLKRWCRTKNMYAADGEI